MPTPNWLDVTSPPVQPAAQPDGKVITDGVILSGNLLEVSSSEAVFAGADDKLVVIVAGNGAFVHRTTIASVSTNNMTITLASAAPTATSGAMVIWGSDNATLLFDIIRIDLQDTVTSLEYLGGAVAASLPQLYFPKGIYMLNGA